MITRDETPFMSSIGKTKATAIYHEWQTDELQKPGNSRIEEGTDYVLPGATSGIGGGSGGTSPSSSTGGNSTGSGPGGAGTAGVSLSTSLVRTGLVLVTTLRSTVRRLLYPALAVLSIRPVLQTSMHTSSRSVEPSFVVT